ncbi:hypothetical protein ACOMHN_002560 [Nucella lapillus]
MRTLAACQQDPHAHWLPVSKTRMPTGCLSARRACPLAACQQDPHAHWLPVSKTRMPTGCLSARPACPLAACQQDPVPKYPVKRPRNTSSIQMSSEVF